MTKTPPRTKNARICVVCGARVINPNSKTVTCDALCGAAKRAKRTRAAQMDYELKNPRPEDERYEYCTGCGMFVSQCQCWDPVNGVN